MNIGHIICLTGLPCNIAKDRNLSLTLDGDDGIAATPKKILSMFHHSRRVDFSPFFLPIYRAVLIESKDIDYSSRRAKP